MRAHLLDFTNSKLERKKLNYTKTDILFAHTDPYHQDNSGHECAIPLG